MTIEINSEAFSQQVHEYYDGSKKVGVVHERIGNLSFTAYSYYDANQLVLIEGLFPFSRSTFQLKRDNAFKPMILF